jgi:hypothetical protein
MNVQEIGKMDIRRTLDGAIYDTTKAEKVMNLVSHNYVGNETDNEITDLFRSDSGPWFLAGHGGACTRWSRERHFERRIDVAGKGIELNDADEALYLMTEHNGPVEAYLEFEAA